MKIKWIKTETRKPKAFDRVLVSTGKVVSVGFRVLYRDGPENWMIDNLPSQCPKFWHPIPNPK